MLLGMNIDRDTMGYSDIQIFCKFGDILIYVFRKPCNFTSSGLGTRTPTGNVERQTFCWLACPCSAGILSVTQHALGHWEVHMSKTARFCF